MTMWRVILACVISVTLMGLLFLLANRFRPDHTDEMCRVRLLRLGQAIALFVEDRGGAAFPGLRNPAPFTRWEPGLAQATGEVLRPYLGGANAISDQLPNESREDWLTRIRRGELSVCPATLFPYQANLELFAGSPSAFARTGETAWAFRCQGRDANRGVHLKGSRLGIHEALLGSSERLVPREELDALRARIHELEAAEEVSTTTDRRRRLDALSNRLSSLERAFSDGRSTASVRRLDNDIEWVAYPP